MREAEDEVLNAGSARVTTKRRRVKVRGERKVKEYRNVR
jgi:hypothetical protein